MANTNIRLTVDTSEAYREIQRLANAAKRSYFDSYEFGFLVGTLFGAYGLFLALLWALH